LRFSALPIPVALALSAARASADTPRRTFEAGRMDGDVALTDVTLSRGVKLGYDRYRLTSERLRLRTDPHGIAFDGEAKLALCPCPDPPLRFATSGGRIEKTGDLLLRWPRVELGGVPVLALPWLWLRAPDRVGILPPILALRSTDGLLLGSGVHLPWPSSRERPSALDLTAAGYTSGGAQLGATLTVPGATRAAVLIDLVHGTRVAMDARGALTPAGPAALAWQLDAIRGDRARSATVDLGPAAQPFDVGAMEASLRGARGPVSAILAGGLVARAIRGEGPIAAGPRAALALGGAIARVGTWSLDAAGAVLGGAQEGPGVPLARASTGVTIDARPGPVEIRGSASARARYAGATIADEESREAAGAARLSLSLPLVRTFEARPGEAALTHWIEPEIAIRGALADVRGAFFAPIEGRVPTTSWIASGGVSSSLGRYAGPALRVDLRAGATSDVTATTAPLFHARLGADARVVAIAIEAAAVGDRDDEKTSGHAVLARGRLGAEGGPWVKIEAAEQRGAGAGQARAIASGAWAALPGDELAYLETSGLTLGTEISIPWGRSFRTSVRGDLDLGSGRLLLVRGVGEYRHRCGCLGLSLVGAHRAGRAGADVALTIDVVPPISTR
jgi:hypothetical protein